MCEKSRSLSWELAVSKWACWRWGRFYHATVMNIRKNSNIWGWRRRVIYIKTPVKMSTWKDETIQDLLLISSSDKRDSCFWPKYNFWSLLICIVSCTLYDLPICHPTCKPNGVFPGGKNVSYMVILLLYDRSTPYNVWTRFSRVHMRKRH